MMNCLQEYGLQSTSKSRQSSCVAMRVSATEKNRRRRREQQQELAAIAPILIWQLRVKSLTSSTNEFIIYTAIMMARTTQQLSRLFNYPSTRCLIQSSRIVLLLCLTAGVGGGRVMPAWLNRNLASSSQCCLISRLPLPSLLVDQRSFSDTRVMLVFLCVKSSSCISCSAAS